MEKFIPNEELAVKNLTAKLGTEMFAYRPQTSWQRIAENICKEMTVFFMENPNTFKISSQQDYETMLEYAVFGIPALKAFDI